MKLRRLLVITFCLLVIIPMALFWIWPYSKALDSEVKEVEQKHLVIAKNLSAAFERYYQDVTGIFSIIDTQSEQQLQSPQFKKLLQSYKFREIVLIDTNGNIQSCLFTHNHTCLTKIDKNILHLANTTVAANAVKMSTVTADPAINSGPILLLVKQQNQHIILAYLATDYIVEMGKRVTFGKKGHAAIVDQAGNVLAHPLDSWIAARKNIAPISAVEKMLAGKTGVEKFYSPALKGDMIAGYTHVPNANWGVMIPQPIQELEDKAKEINETAVFVMLLGLAIALVVTIPVSIILIKPLEDLSQAIKLNEQGDVDIELAQQVPKLAPLEIRELKISFADMMANIKKNRDEISKLAYFDSTTGLPNRNYFHLLANMSLDEMRYLNQKAALVFIDFNEFKSVNDTYGHRVGDELLYLFGRRLSECLPVNPQDQGILSLTEPLPHVISARLGGDEFVILFQNIQDQQQIEQKIRTLFQAVFSEYILYSEIKLMLSGSAGVALFPEHGKNYDELMRLADIAMYDAKSAGKNKIHFSK